jgi:hypothetical protein
MKFNRKSFTISLITTICVVIFSLSSTFLNPIFASLIVFFVYYFSLYWLLDFDIMPIGFVNILLLSSIYIQAISLFIFTLSKIGDGLIGWPI